MTEVAADHDSAAYQELRLSPDVATALLAQKAAAFAASEAQALAGKTAEAERAASAAAPPAGDSAAARAKLSELTASPEWRTAYFSGDPKARKDFSDLTAAVAGGATVDDVLAGAGPVSQLIETTTAGQLSSRNTAIEVDHLKQLGLNEKTIQQVFKGGAVSPAEKEMARVTKEMRLSDPEWSARYLKGGWAERREMSLLSAILSAGAA
jgi:hypothetical protein